MAISMVDILFFITELVKRHPTMGIPALEYGLFANLLIFDYIFVFGKGTGKGKGKGKRERKRNGKRERKKERELRR